MFMSEMVGARYVCIMKRNERKKMFSEMGREGRTDRPLLLEGNALSDQSPSWKTRRSERSPYSVCFFCSHPIPNWGFHFPNSFFHTGGKKEQGTVSVARASSVLSEAAFLSQTMAKLRPA